MVTLESFSNPCLRLIKVEKIVYPILNKFFLVDELAIRRNARLDKCSKKRGIRRQEGNEGRIVYGITLSSNL